MSKRAELSTGEALVGLLEAYGVDTIFGIPGVHNVEMYRALPRSKISHVLVRHEQGAGFMADGYARATGKPGVCFTITGPGFSNILTPMGQAWSDSSPMLVIASALDMADSAQGRGRLHEMLDQRGAAATVTTLHMRAYTPKDVRDAHGPRLRQFRQPAAAPRLSRNPPRHAEGAGGRWLDRARPARSRRCREPSQIAAAVAKLDARQAPGHHSGRRRARCAAEAALAIAEKLNAPILTTTAGKGVVPERSSAVHGLSLGRAAAPRLHPLAADAILCAGSRTSETDFWETMS